MRDANPVNCIAGVATSNLTPLKSVFDKVRGVNRAIKPSPTIKLYPQPP